MTRGHHDIGGVPGAGPIDQSEHSLSDWEILADAVNQALGARGVKRTDEMRRAREEMDSTAYRDMAAKVLIARLRTCLRSVLPRLRQAVQRTRNI